MRRVALLAIAVFAGACSKHAADAVDASADVARVVATKGGIEATLTLRPGQPRLSDEPALELRLAMDPAVDVKAPSPPTTLGGFVVRAYDEPKPSIEAGRKIVTLRWTLEPQTIGRHAIAPLALACTDPRPGAEHATFTLDTPELAVEVTSALASEAASLDALRGPGAPLDVVAKTDPWPWIAGGAALVAFAAGLALWIAKRKNRVEAPVVRTPRELAEDEFQALARAGFLARGDLAGFYVELTAVVRRYIERTTSIRAPEQTTAEFLRAMRGHPAFDAEQQTRLKAFLEAADLVKFAAVRPGRDAVTASFARGQEFVGLASTLVLEAAA